MPFLDSELTRHISPTKTPEYLAGGKPVVSTPIPDVVADYGEVVRFAPFGDSEAFCKQVEAALASPGDATPFDHLPAQTWSEIAIQMEQALDEWAAIQGANGETEGNAQSTGTFRIWIPACAGMTNKRTLFDLE
jgi:hypothetical protein